MNSSQKNINVVLQTILIIILLFASAALVIYTFRTFVWSIFFAMLFYASFDKLNKNLFLYTKNKDISALICITLILFLVILPISIFIIIIIQQILYLINIIQDTINSGELLNLILNFEYIIYFITNDPFFWVNYLNRLGNFINDYSEYFNFLDISGIVGGAYNIFIFSIHIILKIFVYLIFGFLLLYFLFRDGHLLYLNLSQMLPFEQNLMDDFKNQMKLVISSILKGNIFISILQGFFLGLGFFIAGIPNVLLYGFFGSIFSIIPILGTSIVWMPACLYLYFIKNSVGWSIFLGIYCLLSFLILENIVKPKILDKQIGIPSILLFFAIIGGIKEFGISGLILGPLTLALFITIWRLYPYTENNN